MKRKIYAMFLGAPQWQTTGLDDDPRNFFKSGNRYEVRWFRVSNWKTVVKFAGYHPLFNSAWFHFFDEDGCRLRENEFNFYEAS